MGIGIKEKIKEKTILEHLKHLYIVFYGNLHLKEQISEKAYLATKDLAYRIIEIEPKYKPVYKIQLKGLKDKIA